MKLDEIIKTEKQVLESGSYRIEDSYIFTTEIKCIGNLGNSVDFALNFKQLGLSLGGFNIGQKFKALVEMFNLYQDNVFYLRQLTDIPCKVIINDSHYGVGFGSAVEDKFVFIDDFKKIDEF